MKIINIQTAIIMFAVIITSLLIIGCGNAQSENAKTQNNLSGYGNSNVNKSNFSNSAKTPDTVKVNQQSDGLPKFEKQEDYKTGVRQKLLKAGWIPAPSDEGKQNCLGQQSLCDELPELEAGPSSPLGQAVTRWKKADKILLVSTIDNFLFDGYKYEKPENIQSTPKIEGKYIYSSKHEYGEDNYIFELKAENIATYVAEVEGGDGIDWKGTWEWNRKDKTVVVSFANSGDEGKKTYIFKIEGNNLKMIKEPEMPKGVKGFTGNIYKKK